MDTTMCHNSVIPHKFQENQEIEYIWNTKENSIAVYFSDFEEDQDHACIIHVHTVPELIDVIKNCKHGKFIMSADTMTISDISDIESQTGVELRF